MANQSSQADFLTSCKAGILTGRLLAWSCRWFFEFLLCITVLSLASPSNATGPLSVDARNPRYFFNSNGAAVYLGGVYVNEYNLLNGLSTFSAHLDHLQQHNQNFTRVWAWEQSPWFFSDTGQISFTIQPYERTGPGMASDGGLKFDLTRFNQAYFDQLRSRAIEAGERGIYVSVMLFEGFSSQKRVRQVNPWLGDPFELSNNINGINGDPNRNGGGEEFFSLTFPATVTLQEAFVRKIVDTLNDLDNVLYEISGNGLAGSLPWQYHMLDYIKNYQRTKTNRHPVGISQFKLEKLKDVLNSSADWVVVPQTDVDFAMPRSDKVIVVEPSHALLDSPTAHRWVWKHFTAGNNLVYLRPTSPNQLVNRRVDTAIGQAIGYSQVVNLAAMTPAKRICSSEYCLANPAEEYLTYLPGGGAVTLDLSDSREKFVPTWFDTVTGEAILGGVVTGGKSTRLVSSVRGETVLHLVREVGSAIANSSDSREVPAALPPDKTGGLSGIVATPVITPNGGIYSGQVSITLKTSTPGASIYYTTDGKPATESSRRYTGPFTLTSSALIKAKAFRNNLQPSAEVAVWFSNASVPTSFNFSMSNSGSVAVAAGSSATNTITTALSAGSSETVSFSASGMPSGATTSFSLPSCKPSCSTVLSIGTTTSTPTGNFPITVTATGAGVTKTTDLTLSVTAPATVATPTISPDGGSFTGPVSVTIQTATPGASIHYTTDGSNPTQAAAHYNARISLAASAVLKAKAFKSGFTGSAVATASFTLNQGAPAAGLVAHWKFDEGTGSSAADSSGSGNLGSLVNGPLWTAGRVGNAIYFDGTDDHVSVQDSTSLDLPNSFTLSAWVNPASTFTDFRSIVVKNYSYYLYGSVAGYCGDGSALGGFNDQTTCQATPLPTNEWTHLVLSRSGSTLILYRNGVAVGDSTASGTPSATTGNLQIGASQYGEYFKGLIDEVRIYSRTLSAAEVESLYQHDSMETSQTVATPLIAPTGGTYAGSVTVTIQSATSGAVIYYTTNGSIPTQSSTLYSGPLTLSSSAQLKAKAFKNGYTASAEASASFTITQPFNFSLANDGNKSVVTGSSVTASISAGLVSGSTQAVSFSVSGVPSNATTAFSSLSCSPVCSTKLTIGTNASTPTGSFPLTVTAQGGGVTKTTTLTLSVTAPTVATPSMSPNGGSFLGSVSVQLQTVTPGASIYYTTNGSAPTQSSTLYSGPIELTSSAQLKAKAFKDGHTASGEASASFTIAQPFAFSLASAGNSTVTAGSSVSNSITASLTSGNAQDVSFTVSGLPSGASAAFSSASCAATCSTTLTITASAATPAATSTITVSASGGGMTKTTAFSLTVLTSPPPSNGVLHLVWADTSDSEDGFRIERLTNGRTDKTLTVGPDIASYTDSGLVNGTLYCYRVRAFNSAGDSGVSNEACLVATAPPTN